MAWWHKPSQWAVTLRCTGRHPYLRTNELDYFEGKKDVEIIVTAKGWADAENKALIIGPIIKSWGWSVHAIERIEHP